MKIEKIDKNIRENIGETCISNAATLCNAIIALTILTTNRFSYSERIDKLSAPEAFGFLKLFRINHKNGTTSWVVH